MQSTTLYQNSRQIEYWIEKFPAAVVPTYGVRIDPPAGKSSCRCWRCQPGDTSAGKHPLQRWAHREEGIHPNAIRAYLKSWQEDPSSVGWALATGRANLAVLDVDPRNGGDIELAKLLAKNGQLPRTPQDVTGGGGWHWYFMAPTFAPSVVGKSAIQLAAGVELLTGNHLIQIPPSIHYTGHSYKWAAAPWDTAFAPLPGWIATQLQDALTPKQSPTEVRYARIKQIAESNERIKRARAYLGSVPGAVSGQGGYAHTIATVLKIVKGFGLTESDAYDVILEWNLACSPPWKPAELRAKVKWAYESATPDGFLLDARRDHKPTDRLPASVKIRIGSRVVLDRSASNSNSLDAGPSSPATIEPCSGCGEIVCQCHRWPHHYCRLDDIAGVKVARRRTPGEIAAAAGEEIAKLRRQFAPCDNPRCAVVFKERRGKESLNFYNFRCRSWKCGCCGHLHRDEWSANVRSRIQSSQAYFAAEIPEISYRAVIRRIQESSKDNPEYQRLAADLDAMKKRHRRELRTVAKIDESFVEPTKRKHQEQIKEIKSRLRNAAANYFGVMLQWDGFFLIVANVPFAEAQKVSGDEAKAFLTSAIQATDKTKRPVRASHGWKITAPPKSKDKGELVAIVKDELFSEDIYTRAQEKGVEILPIAVPAPHRFRLLHMRGIDMTGMARSQKMDIAAHVLDVPVGDLIFATQRSNGKRFALQKGERRIFGAYEEQGREKYDASPPHQQRLDASWC